MRYFSPDDTVNQKLQIQTRLGSLKSCKYFNLLTRYLSLKVSKHEFDRLCLAIIGRENVPLHNHFIKSILKKSCLPKIAPAKQSRVEGPLTVKTPNGCNNLQNLCKDFLKSPRKSRTPSLRDRRFKDRPSPLGPHGKNNSNGFENSTPKTQEGFENSTPKTQEQQSNTEPFSVGNKLPVPVEDGEEVDQDSERLAEIRKSPIRAPLGIPIYDNRAQRLTREGLPPGSVTDTCESNGHLPDTHSLMKRMEHNLETEECKVSADAANVLNKALDVYLKRLIKPCLDLATSKSVNKFSGRIQSGKNKLATKRCVQKQIGSASASISEFRTAMELNPTILGEDWPLHLEKVCFRAMEE